MKLVERCQVEGSEPPIQLGHRVYRDAQGQEKTSKRWFAQYCLDGRHHYEPLKTSNKAAAIRKAHEIVQRLGRGEERKVQRRRELVDLVKDYLELQQNRGRAPKTMEKYKFVLDGLVAWWTEQSNQPASAFTEKDFWAFNQKMVKDELAAKTRADRLTIVKQLFKWAQRSGKLLVNPLVNASVPEAPATLQPCFTPEQVGVLIANANDHQKPIFAMMGYAGMRFGEVRDLRWTDVLLDQGKHGFIVVQRGGSGDTTKSKKVRRIPIHPELRTVLAGLPKSFERVFTAPASKEYPKGDQPLSERRLLVSLKRLCKRCGFAKPDQYKLHTFRHAFCSMCARNNVSYRYALEWMGHSSSDILDLYYTMYDSTAETAMGTILYPAPPQPPQKKPAQDAA